MGRSLIGSSSSSRTLTGVSDITTQQQTSKLNSALTEQTIQLTEQANQVNDLLTQQQIMLSQLVSFQDQIKYLIKLHLGETPPDLLALNEKKTELITIMNDYLTQKVTRVDTVNRLSTLEIKIA